MLYYGFLNKYESFVSGLLEMSKEMVASSWNTIYSSAYSFSIFNGKWHMISWS